MSSWLVAISIYDAYLCGFCKIMQLLGCRNAVSCFYLAITYSLHIYMLYTSVHSLSSNGLLAEQNWSANTLFVQLAGVSGISRDECKLFLSDFSIYIIIILIKFIQISVNLFLCKSIVLLWL